MTKKEFVRRIKDLVEEIQFLAVTAEEFSDFDTEVLVQELSARSQDTDHDQWVDMAENIKWREE